MRGCQTVVRVQLCWVVLLGTLLGLPSASVADSLDLLEADIGAWRLVRARERLAALDAGAAESPRGIYLKGRLQFFEGDVAASVATLRRAVEGNRSEMAWKALRDRAIETARVFSRLERVAGKSGRFVFRLDSEWDGLLIPYAEEALTRQADALVGLFDSMPPGPVEVVILSDSRALAAVSGLSREQIERSGTVGVTQYGRIMILSPRSLVSGYPWLDTMAHELVHYLVTRDSLDRMPIWLHEGIAKLLEKMWQGGLNPSLLPEEAYLLDRAVGEGRLIPLRRFHPSVAYLPTQEDVSLAYAQALSFTAYLNERLPSDWIRRLTAGLAGGTSLDRMLVTLGGANLQRYYSWWRQSAAGKRHTPPPAVGVMKRRFKQGTVGGGGTGESIHSIEVRKHLRLGDLLRLRGHMSAATQEFERARELARFLSPEIGDRLAGTLLEIGKFVRAKALLKRVAELYPAHVNTFVQLARAHIGLGETTEAAAAFRQARALNPFDPEVHCTASDLYREMGDADAAKRENISCRKAILVQKRSEGS